MATKTKTVAPAKQFKELLPKITTRELHGVAVAIMIEGADRAENYADAACTRGAPREVAEEGIAFVTKFEALWNGFAIGDNSAKDARWRLHEAREELQEAWNV